MNDEWWNPDVWVAMDGNGLVYAEYVNYLLQVNSLRTSEGQAG